MEQTFDHNNPLKALSECHNKLSFRALEVVLISCAVSFLITQKYFLLPEARYILAIDIIGVAAAIAIYRKDRKDYSNSESADPETIPTSYDEPSPTPHQQQAYSQAKKKKYNTISALIYATCLALAMCQEVWIAVLAFAMWIWIFFDIPTTIGMNLDFPTKKNAEYHF